MTSKTWNSGRIDGAIDRQQCGKHTLSAMNQHTTIEGLLEAVFCMRSMLRLYVYTEDRPLVRCG
jgi:hypothetical protein